MIITFALSLPHDAASVPVVRRLCRSVLNDLGVHETCVSDIEVAVTEACTNILKHASGPDDSYEVAVEINGAACTIRVTDSGVGFEADMKGRSEALAGAEGGRGIHLIRALVDEVHFVSRPEDGTVVHLEKKLVLTPHSLLERLADAAT